MTYDAYMTRVNIRTEREAFSDEYSIQVLDTRDRYSIKHLLIQWLHFCCWRDKTPPHALYNNNSRIVISWTTGVGLEHKFRWYPFRCFGAPFSRFRTFLFLRAPDVSFKWRVFFSTDTLILTGYYFNNQVHTSLNFLYVLKEYLSETRKIA